MSGQRSKHRAQHRAQHQSQSKLLQTRSNIAWLVCAIVCIIVLLLSIGTICAYHIFAEHDVRTSAAQSLSPSSGQDAVREQSTDNELTRQSVPKPHMEHSAQAQQMKLHSAQQTRYDTLANTLQSQISGYSGVWSVYVEDLNTGAQLTVNSQSSPSASLIKLYIATAVYQAIEQHTLSDSDTVQQQLRSMITVSSNEAANALVVALGNGNAQAGMQVVNTTATQLGFTDTAMHVMLDSSGSADPMQKLTSVRDCGQLLAKAYRGELVSKASSDALITLLQQQQRVTKIPAGVPQNVQTANKTGEVPGAENDAAIIYAPNGAYVLTIMSNNVNNAQAQSNIKQLSATVWQQLEG